ncbi:hypothetical protein DVQ32_16185 [Yersinia enterocolitica]|nr:hypothetical protein [Yersinia enterocolitica]EKN6028265.1 hypothetical protein [Yersinia enterocolitica]
MFSHIEVSANQRLRLYQPAEYSVMANSDLQMKRPYPPLSFVNEFRPHIELVPANEVPFQLKSIYQNKALLCQKIL